MKFEGQIDIIMANEENSKPEVTTQIQDGDRRHLENTLFAAISLFIYRVSPNFAG